MQGLYLVASVATVVTGLLYVINTNEDLNRLFFALFLVSWGVNLGFLVTNPSTYELMDKLDGLVIPTWVMVLIAVAGLIAVPVIYIKLKKSGY